MFQCYVCKSSPEPKVKPHHVIIGTRPVEYHNSFSVEDDWGNPVKREVDSVGQEITGEKLVCPACALEHYGIEPLNSGAQATKRDAGHGFIEKLVPTFRKPLISTVVHNALERISHKSKRAQADSAVVVPGIKSFVDLNPKFVF